MFVALACHHIFVSKTVGSLFVVCACVGLFDAPFLYVLDPSSQRHLIPTLKSKSKNRGRRGQSGVRESPGFSRPFGPSPCMRKRFHLARDKKKIIKKKGEEKARSHQGEDWRKSSPLTLAMLCRQRSPAPQKPRRQKEKRENNKSWKKVLKLFSLLCTRKGRRGEEKRKDTREECLSLSVLEGCAREGRRSVGWSGG